jgi:hypothetical protein
MRTYWIDNERGFANEYTLYVADHDTDAEYLATEMGCERITRRAWIYALRLRHDHAGYCALGFHPARSSSDIAGAIHDCAVATRYGIDCAREGEPDGTVKAPLTSPWFATF